MIRFRKEAGFTAIELLLVLVVLAILIGIAVPGYFVLTQRMKVNTDRSSAGNIANAVRAWYTDCSNDVLLEAELAQMPVGTFVKLTDVAGLERYVDPNMTPVSLLNEDKVTDPNQRFLAGLLGVTDGNVKVIIAVGTDVIEMDNSPAADYDGTMPGIIYIENK